jgi:carboxymethylenebutenolidase
MKQLLSGISVFLFATVSVEAQDASLARLENSPRHHEWVTLDSTAGKVDAFVVYPERSDKALAVIVIHENRGLSDWVRGVADQLAEAGYLAIAPDLLTGKAPNGGRTSDFATSDDARNAIYALDGDAVIANLDAIAEYAKSIPAANGKLAVAGFCWGGSQTWRVAVARDDLVLACPFYGTAPEDAAAFAAIDCPVFGFYGGDDNRVNATIEPTAEAMSSAGKSYEPQIYEGAGHGFMRRGEEETETANSRAMEQGWKRWLRLLKEAEST